MKFAGKIMFLPTPKGGIPMFQNYTFSQDSARSYWCSSRIRGKCAARLTTDSDGNVVKGRFDHCHPPPFYHKSADGLYNKILIYKNTK